MVDRIIIIFSITVIRYSLCKDGMKKKFCNALLIRSFSRWQMGDPISFILPSLESLGGPEVFLMAQYLSIFSPPLL